MSAASENSPLITVNPPDSLTFKLERNANSKCTLKVSNASNQRVLFKVKTTQPSWYYVRPNQQILDIGQTEDIAIVLVELEINRFLDQAAINKVEKLDKHRFLVQSKTISDEDFERLNALAPAARPDEFTKIWDAAVKDDKKNIKLKVDFQYGQTNSISFDDTKQFTSSSFATDDTRQKLEMPQESDKTTTGRGSDFEALKAKYDAVVEYTVQLTAERDAILNKLEESQRELARNDVEKRRSRDNDVLNTPGRNGVAVNNGVNAQGFSLPVLAFVAVIFFLMGKYAVGYF